MNTTFKQDQRLIETVIEAGDGIQVSVTTSHAKSRKSYRTSIYRQRVQDGFVRFAIFKDNLGVIGTDAPRYSAKKMQELHEAMLTEYVTGQEDSLKAWARDIKTSA